jgi:hypothetical protein
MDPQLQPAAPLPMKNIRCLGNHSEILELTKATTISLKTERTKPILDAGNDQRAIENEFHNPEIQKITGIIQKR